MNSGAGLSASPHWSAYAASKFGLRALADSLRAEEQEHGVRVTTVYPGRTATPMQQKVHEQEGTDYDADAWIDPATVAGAILHVLDLPPDATISDLTIRPTSAAAELGTWSTGTSASGRVEHEDPQPAAGDPLLVLQVAAVHLGRPGEHRRLLVLGGGPGHGLEVLPVVGDAWRGGRPRG